MGNAEIPAAPIMGLIFSFRNKFMIFASITPEKVSKMNAQSPSPIIIRVWTVMKFSAFIVNAMVMPKNSVTRFVSTSFAVSVR